MSLFLIDQLCSNGKGDYCGDAIPAFSLGSVHGSSQQILNDWQVFLRRIIIHYYCIVSCATLLTVGHTWTQPPFSGLLRSAELTAKISKPPVSYGNSMDFSKLRCNLLFSNVFFKVSQLLKDFPYICVISLPHSSIKNGNSADLNIPVASKIDRFENYSGPRLVRIWWAWTRSEIPRVNYAMKNNGN